tara:strand:+ start:237 stop:491 length:255 start_codon:yes stop_codon:yes gene_type:complete
MTRDQVMEKALKVLNKEQFQDFAKALHQGNQEKALDVAYNEMKSAEEVVLSSVRKDECDFVIMSHYKQSYELVQVMEGGLDEDC